MIEPYTTGMAYCVDTCEGMSKMAADSVDLIVTDPPYGYSFMGKDWDKAVPSVAVWQEALRVLKPGAFAFVMSAPRQDCMSQMIVRLSEAGFDVAFTPMLWAYASGFPKAMNIRRYLEKQIKKHFRVERQENAWSDLGDALFVETLFPRELLEVGVHTSSRNSVVDRVVAIFKARKLDVNVKIVGAHSCEAPHTLSPIIIAAENVGATCYAMELQERWVDVICERWEAARAEMELFDEKVEQAPPKLAQALAHELGLGKLPDSLTWFGTTYHCRGGTVEISFSFTVMADDLSDAYYKKQCELFDDKAP